MTIEVANYVADLQPVNPPSTDPTSQGDDHIRLIKQVLQNQFPGSSRAWAIPGVQTFSTSPVTVTKPMDGSTLFISTASGATVVNLPALAAADIGWTCNLFKTSTDVNPMFVTPPSGTIVSGTVAVAKARRCIPGIRIAVVWTGTQYYCSRALASPIGSLMPFYSTILPAGFEWPNGQTLTSGSYLEYAAITGAYTTPDCRGLVDATLDNLGGAAAGRLPSGYIAQTTLGAIGGADGIALSTAMIPAHYHVMYFNDPGHVHNFNQSGGLGVSSYVYTNTSPMYFYYQGGGQGAQQYATYIQANTTGCYVGYPPGNNNSITSTVGSGSAHANLQPTVMMAKLLVVE